MPKIKAKVLAVKNDGGKLLARIQLNGKLPRVGETLTVKWGSTRTLSQNSFYWVFLTWLINDGGLKDIGHFDPQALHENLKAHFKTDTTTTFNKVEMGEWMDQVNQFMIDFFHIDTSPFWKTYQDDYQV